MSKILYGLIGIAVAILIASCGSGGSLAGGGESGLGGTGIGLVKGDIAAVETALNHNTEYESILLASLQTLITQAYAQTGSLAGITISGGGQTVTTNISGEFLLFDVEPSRNFILSLRLPFGQMFEFDIGSLAAGEAIIIRNIVLNETTGGASFGSLEAVPFNGDITDFILSSPTVSAEQVIQEIEEARRAEQERLAQEEAEEEEVEEDPVNVDPNGNICPPGDDCDGDGVPDDAI